MYSLCYVIFRIPHPSLQTVHRLSGGTQTFLAEDSTSVCSTLLKLKINT